MSRNWFERQWNTAKKGVAKAAKWGYGEARGIVKTLHDDAKNIANKATSPLDAITTNLPLILIGGVIVIALLPRLLDSASNAQKQVTS